MSATTTANLALVPAFVALFFAAQAVSTGPDDIDAARDMAASTRDAITTARQQADEFKRIKAHTEAIAWSKCKEFHGNAAQVYEVRGESYFVCRRLVGVL